MDRIKKYNAVLGLKESVNVAELKRLYRMRAKVLHPDRNSDPSSHEQFVLLNEAYEFYMQVLIDAEEKKKEKFFKSKKYPERYYNESWNVEKRMAARRNAAKKARMKYEQFEKRGYYNTLNKLFYAMDVVRFILALVLIFCLPVFLFIQDQFRGLIVALTVQALTYRLWSRAIKRFIKPIK